MITQADFIPTAHPLRVRPETMVTFAPFAERRKVMRPGFDSPPWHDDPDINAALIHLADALCTFERATSRQSALVFRCETGALMRLQSGKPMVSIDVSDEQLLNTIEPKL